jgi:hypothetical protein
VHTASKGRSGVGGNRRRQLLVGLQGHSLQSRLGVMGRQQLEPGGFVRQARVGGGVQSCSSLISSSGGAEERKKTIT